MLITNLIVAFTIFLLGLYVSCRYTSKSFKDGFYNKSDCPDLLVQNEDGLQLLNSNKAKNIVCVGFDGNNDNDNTINDINFFLDEYYRKKEYISLKSLTPSKYKLEPMPLYKYI